MITLEQTMTSNIVDEHGILFAKKEKGSLHEENI